MPQVVVQDQRDQADALGGHRDRGQHRDRRQLRPQVVVDDNTVFQAASISAGDGVVAGPALPLGAREAQLFDQRMAMA